jgi:5-methyltetrahydrofolate--homocysteine methyltransferase
VQLVQSITDVPLSIDSSIVAALEAGLAVYKGKALVNSVTGEDERLEAVLPLVKKYGAAVIAISNDETGISEDPDVRFAVAKKIVERAMDYGIPACDVVVDPLVMPIGAINQAGVQVMRLVRRLRTELKVNTSCGASNVSFGLPNRDGINSAFLTMAMGAGSPPRSPIPCMSRWSRPAWARMSCSGHDPDCARWIRRFRDAPPPAAAAAPAAAGDAPRGRREGGHRRRPALRADSHGLPRSARRVHAVGQARQFPGGHTAAAGGAQPRRGHRFGVRRPRLCGRCQVLVAEGEFAKHGVSSSSASLSPLSEPEMRFSKRAPLAPGGACRVRRASSRCGHRRAREQPGASPGGAQGGRRARHRAESRGAPALRASEAAGHARSVRRSAPPVRGAGAEWSLKDLACDLSVLQTLQPILRAAILAGHGGGARGEADHRRVAGPARGGITVSRSISARPPSPRISVI